MIDVRVILIGLSFVACAGGPVPRSSDIASTRAAELAPGNGPPLKGTPPAALKKVDIGQFYPPLARARGIEGVVVLRLLIDAEGKLEAVTIVSDPGDGFGAAAVAAVREFRFSPAKVDGKPVATSIPFKFSFKLKD